VATRRKRGDLSKLDVNTALITGGISGIGLATATQSVRQVAYVFLTGRRDHFRNTVVMQGEQR
jgi:short-subunit dehydrogenase involved in D-alanine esterification of teichoic acids